MRRHWGRSRGFGLTAILYLPRLSAAFILLARRDPLGPGVLKGAVYGLSILLAEALLVYSVFHPGRSPTIAPSKLSIGGEVHLRLDAFLTPSDSSQMSFRDAMRPWLFLTALLLAVPVIVTVMWGIAVGLESLMPECQSHLIGSEGSGCEIGGIDMGVILIFLAAPFFISAFLLVPYLILVTSWLTVLLMRSVWWMVFKR